MRTLRFASLGLTAMILALPACTFVTQQDYLDKLACLDEDQDGAVREPDCETNTLEDCDDNNPNRQPENEEIPYDGIDNDCDDQDEVDQDGDGYPGISQADWEAIAESYLTWDSTLKAEVDCNDLDALIYPNAATEEWYDGVDSDCNEDDDYDADGDGHAASVHWLSFNAPGAPAYEGTLPQDDCDDNDDQTYPGSELDSIVDAPHDGVDNDCDGGNDFDEDGDTYIEDTYTSGSPSAFQEYLDLYGYDITIGSGHDCNDTPLGEGGISGDNINPGVTETWYNGIDENCDGLDDYDQDQDLFIPDGQSGYTGILPAGDCDDTDPTVSPGTLELIGDATDQDCDGGDDTSAFYFHDYEWLDPRTPVVGATDHHYLLSVTAAQHMDDTLASQVGITLRFDPATADARAEPDRKLTWEGAVGDYPLGGGLAMLVEPERFYLVTSYQRELTTGTGPELRSYLRFHRYEWNGVISNYVPQTQFHFLVTADPYLSFDIQVDEDGYYWALGCGQYTAHYIKAENNLAGQFKALTYFAKDFSDPSFTYAIGHACVLTPQTGGAVPIAHAFNDGSDRDGVRKHAFDLMTTDFSINTTNTDWDGFAVWDATQRDGLITFAGGDSATSCNEQCITIDDGSSIETIAGSRVAYSADAVEFNDVIYVVAVVDDITSDGIDDVIVLYGDPATSMTEVRLPYEHPDYDLEPVGASIHVDADRLFVAVSGVDITGSGNDGVGWVFMGF